MKISNPRFPHRCRILRFASTLPMEDQPENYDPMADDVSDEESTGDFSEGTGESNKIRIVYAGICRSDNRDTISDNGDVIASYRTLALPLKQDEWTEETIPQEGDRVELQRFGYKEYGAVIDRRPSNLGTHILWKYARN